MSEKGLADVVAAQTAISDIDGQLGKLWYVGYDIDDLAANATFEETCFLLHNQRLPTIDELDETSEALINDREMTPFGGQLMETLAVQSSPMSMVRTSISAASAHDPDGWNSDAEANYRKAFRLIARLPTRIAR